MSQQRDVRQAGRGLPEESRLPMPWGDQQDGELLAFYRGWLPCDDRARAETGKSPVFFVGARWWPTSADSPDRVLAMLINLSTEAKKLDMPGSWSNMLLASRVGVCYQA